MIPLTINKYAYVMNNSLRRFDPLGQDYNDVIDMSLERLSDAARDSLGSVDYAGLSDEQKEEYAKEALRQLGYQVDTPDEYAKALTQFQGLTGMSRTGVLDIDTLVAAIYASQAGLTQEDFQTNRPMGRIGDVRYWTREQWGAEDPVGSMTKMGDITRIVLHQTDWGGETPEDMQDCHQIGKGYSDIGYHFLVDADGSIYEARAIEYQGAHAKANGGNVGSIGVSFMGKFTNDPCEQGKQPTQAQLDAGEKLINALCDAYNIPNDEDHIFGHFYFSPESRSLDPGYMLRLWFLPWTLPI